MNNKLLCLSFLLISGFSAFSQRTVNTANCREGESVEYCFQHTKMNELQHTHPELYQQYLAEKQAEANKPHSQNVEKSGIVYTIPVVFHVLHFGGLENISNDQLYDAINILNRDYRLQNVDANNVHPAFQGLPADVEIEFALATKAPNGACFRGITRTFTSETFSGDGQDQVSAVVNGNDVYQGQWPPNKYLNIYVCDDIGGAAGYTFNPGGWTGSSMYFNGIFVLHNYTGSIGTSTVFTSRTLTHEVGHWLNLSHTWGGTNNPGCDGTSTNPADDCFGEDNCTEDDGVADTPNTIGVTSCNLNESSCGPLANVENYMDYSYCSKMFTQGQVTRMRNAVTSSTAGRNNLWTTSNLAAVGADGDVALCKAEFYSNKMLACVGEEIQFQDDSYNSVSGWNWTFTGGSPATSTEQNPTITYSAPGTYTVSLSATDGTSSDIETKTAYITVLENNGGLPFYESFEGYTALNGTSGWYTYNPNGNNTFAITTSAAHTGAKSVKLTNFGQSGQNFDELISSAVDLSGSSAGNTTFSFRYSYRRKQQSIVERLRLFFTPDCGDNWILAKNMSGSALSIDIVPTAWTPSSQADWTTVHIEMTATTPTGVPYDTFFVDNFRYKFEFEGNNGNNIFIDDINIYAGPPSDNVVTSGIEELGMLSGLNLFPNPTENELNLSFNIEENQAVEITFLDLTGKVVKTTRVNAAIGSNQVHMNTSELSSGVYFLHVKTGSAQKALQFIKQ